MYTLVLTRTVGAGKVYTLTKIEDLERVTKTAKKTVHNRRNKNGSVRNQ